MLRSWRLVSLCSLVAAGILTFPQSSLASDELLLMSEVTELSFEELLNVEVKTPAAITRVSTPLTPASVTVITSEQIQGSSARNIYDLIEERVPGAIWFENESGPVLGIRGTTAARNYKLLLRVNDRVMNSKGRHGAKTELEHWDMSDIERIEVIRGPGSVTYGPGAIAGVINIYTHTAKTFEGSRASARYVTDYDSKGASFSTGKVCDDFNYFVHGSVQYTDGDTSRRFLGDDDGKAGYIGEDIKSDSEVLDSFGDYQDLPQVKFHVDSEYGENWRFWGRYTQQGSHWASNETKTDFGNGPENQQGSRARQVTGVAEFSDELSKEIGLSLMLSVDSLDSERRTENVRHPDPGHILNKGSDFSETEVFVRAVTDWSMSDSFELAVGSEYSFDYYGRGWGDSKNDMRLGDDRNLVSGPQSNAISPDNKGSADRDGNAIYIDDGWDTHTFSLFSEANYKVSPWLQTLLSGRVDHTTHQDWIFSPRVAFLTTVSEGHFVKLILQRSVRQNTAEQSKANYETGIDTDEEQLDSVELIYSGYLTKDLSYNLTSFYNEAEVVAFESELNRTIKAGDLQFYGIEADLTYQRAASSLGVAYSFVKQTAWDLDDDLDGSGISYSDYQQPINDNGATLLGEGNDLNNFPIHQFKIFGSVSLLEKLTLHSDARVSWDFKGSKDGLQSLESAVAGEEEEADVAVALNRLDEVDTFDYDFRLNASLRYSLTEQLDVSLFAQNLLSSNRAKRYSFSNGNNDPAPNDVRFLEEPRTFGLRADYRF